MGTEINKYVEVKVPKNPTDRQLAIAAYKALEQNMFEEDQEDLERNWLILYSGCCGNYFRYKNPHYTEKRSEYGVTQEDIKRNIHDVTSFLELTGLKWHPIVSSCKCEKEWRREEKQIKDWETIWLDRRVFESSLDLIEVIRTKDPNYVYENEPEDRFYTVYDEMTKDDIKDALKELGKAYKNSEIKPEEYLEIYSHICDHLCS